MLPTLFFFFFVAVEYWSRVIHAGHLCDGAIPLNHVCVGFFFVSLILLDHMHFYPFILFLILACKICSINMCFLFLCFRPKKRFSANFLLAYRFRISTYFFVSFLAASNFIYNHELLVVYF